MFSIVCWSYLLDAVTRPNVYTSARESIFNKYSDAYARPVTLVLHPCTSNFSLAKYLLRCWNFPLSPRLNHSLATDHVGDRESVDERAHVSPFARL
jgi:hypothetical protein